jgi:predicted MFS family arabinose efflux permease
MDPARRAATLVFAATGTIAGAWAGRLPAIQEGLGLSAAQLSAVILAIEGGAIAGLPAGGALVTRFGSERCLRAGYALFATAFGLAAVAPSLVALMAVVGVKAAANSTVDVAANAAGVALERRERRPLLPSLHAAHSLGVAIGGLSAVVAALAGIGPAAHFAAIGLAALSLGAWASRRLGGGEPPPRTRARRRPSRRLALIGLMAFCALLVEGVASNWSAVHLHSGLGAPPALASAAFTGFALTLALGRLAAGRLVARHGRVAVVRAAGLAAAAAAGVVVAAPSPPVAVAGWAALGIAIAGVTPIAFAAAPDASAAPAPVAIASATTVGYLGSFSGPPLVGLIAGASGLATGLAVLVPAALGVAVLAGPAMPSRESPPHRLPGQRGPRR